MGNIQQKRVDAHINSLDELKQDLAWFFNNNTTEKIDEVRNKIDWIL